VFLTGSSNAETFAVPRGAGTPYRSGTQYIKTHDVRMGWHYGADMIFPRVWRQSVPGHLILWDHEVVFPTPSLPPGIWVIYQELGTLQYIWESEELADENRPNACPIITDHPTSMIPVAGGAAKALLPGKEDIIAVYDQIESLSSIPEWMEETIFGEEYGNGAVITPQHIFWKLLTSMLVVRHLPLFFSMNTYWQTSRIQENWRILLIWLRAASMMLYNHEGESCIPLLMDQFIYDAEMNRVRRPT